MAKKPSPAADRKLPKNAVSKPARVTIRKLPTGVRGLDDILGGGIPEFSFNVIAGMPGSRHETRAVITENYRNRGGLYPVSLHIVQGSVIEVLDATHARGQVQGFSEQASEAHTVITSFRYHDEYERVDGRWLFASRTVLTLYAMTHAELAAGGLAQDLRKRWPHREAAPAELPPFLFSPGM